MLFFNFTDLTHDIIACALKIHNGLGPGFLESVYQSALAHEVRKKNHQVEVGRRISVIWDGVVMGEFVTDLLVDEKVIVEVKAIAALVKAHQAQLDNYLAATGVEVGLLLNFGAPSLQIRRRSRAPTRRTSRTTPDPTPPNRA